MSQTTIGVGVGVTVGSGVGVGEGTGVDVGVGVDVNVGVQVGVNVLVGFGVGVGSGVTNEHPKMVMSSTRIANNADDDTLFLLIAQVPPCLSFIPFYWIR